eukprot:1800296-Prymnesium_polylepis.1
MMCYDQALLALTSEMRTQITGQQRQMNALDSYVNAEVTKLWSAVTGMPNDSLAGSGNVAAKH